MPERKYCVHCGAELSWIETGKPCPQCGKFPSGPDQLQVTLEGVTEAVKQQSGFAASILSAMAAAQMLPLIDILHNWWDRLSAADRNNFSHALAARGLQLVAAGVTDEQLKDVVLETVDKEVLQRHLDALLADTDDHAFGKAVIERTVYQLDNNMLAEVKEGLRDAVHNITDRAVHKEAKRIEAAVLEYLPKVDEMARDIAEDIAKKEVRDTKATLTKLIDKGK